MEIPQPAEESFAIRRSGFEYEVSRPSGRAHQGNAEEYRSCLRAGGEYAEIAQNDLAEMSLASSAVDGTSLVIRTEKALYRIGGSR